MQTRISKDSISCISILLILVLGLFLTSCSQPDAMGSVSLSFDNSKSIEPGSSATVSSIRFYGAKNDGTILQPKILSLVDGPKVDGLTVGTWTFSVEGLNSEGATITEVATQSGVNIKSDKLTQIFFVLRYLTIGNGDYSLTVNWPEGLPEFKKVEATVGNETVEGTVTGNSVLLTGTKPVGDYLVGLIFTNKSGTTKAFSSLEMANIYKSLESKGTIKLEAADFPQAGKPVVTVTDITGGKQVTISGGTSGAAILYTTDGTDPVLSSSLYTSAIELTSAGTKTIKAIACKEGMIDSSVASTSVIVEQAAIPTFSPSSATFSSTQTVTMTSTAGSTIYYTTDGTTIPTTGSSAITSGGSITVSATTTIKAMTVKSGMVNSAIGVGVYTKKKIYAIGDTGPAGGFIFYINPNAATQDWTYLEAAPTDNGPWLWGSAIKTDVTATAIGTGKVNTAIIVAKMGIESIAAKECADKKITYNNVTYSDWFLPSKDELNQIYIQKLKLGSFCYGHYWSSSEYDMYNSWDQFFGDDGRQNAYGKNANYFYVRAIRSFK
ncbi:chitobiase/beta-hexosaminidase C-terminal domain-containing protein [uncultured Sphaerochaeta sp.]|uniref:chitobiase/beta-hexosaminidase C-terminal domain-containing protein n=1 Tax=uncultured Sphaerochaeta sp. TaxID=886478 RepID=UPI002A0A4DFF|nr:chitobiase/beta-hexosaminidase C-terminal domain-containing protein [uncultured Sphaerochaeta sp.]